MNTGTKTPTQNNEEMPTKKHTETQEQTTQNNKAEPS